MALGRIGAYAQDVVAQGLQFAEMIAQRAGFGRTTGGGILGIKIKYDLTAGEIAHAPFASLLIDSENFGYFVSDLHNDNIYCDVEMRQQRCTFFGVPPNERNLKAHSTYLRRCVLTSTNNE